MVKEADGEKFAPTPHEATKILEVKAVMKKYPRKSGDIRCAFLFGRDPGKSDGEPAINAARLQKGRHDSGSG